MTSMPADDDARLDALLIQVLDAEAGAEQPALAAACEAAPELAARLRRRYRALARFGFTDALDDDLPRRFGDYRIERRLGRGGMGVVYEATHSTLTRRVALKCIRPELLPDERARERFRRETVALAALQHPGLCTLYECGEVGGQPYLAMQYVDGETLEVQLARARASGWTCWGVSAHRDTSGTDSGQVLAGRVRDAVTLVVQLARAVDAMHRAGIVHRDLKPANVMVTAAGPVLVDFGLARNLADTSAALTVSNDAVGTPAYMAPEQVDPRGRTVDVRTDVHALGAILYECLALRPPLLGAGRDDTYRRILREAPVELRQLQPAASRDLSAVVHRALAKDPRARLATAAELADELECTLRGQPTRTRPPGAMRRLAVWARQRPATVSSLLTLLLALSAGLAVAVGLLRQAQRATSIHESLLVAASDPPLGLLLACEALEQGGGERALSAAYDALACLRQAQEWPLQNTGNAVAATDDGRLLVAGDWDGGVLIVKDGVARSARARGRTRHVAVHAGRDRVLVVGHLLRAMLFDTDGTVVAELLAQPASVLRAVPEGNPRLARAIVDGGLQGDVVHLITRDGRVSLFDLDGAPVPGGFHAPRQAGIWVGAAREPRTGAVALGSSDGTVVVFDRSGAAVLPERRLHAGPVRFVEFAPDGRSLLVAPGHAPGWRDVEPQQTEPDFAATILPLDGREPRRLPGHRAPVTSASWSADGTRVLTTGEDGIALLWQVDTPEQLPVQLSHDKPVVGGVFFANDRRVLTRMENADPVQWTVEGWRIGELRGHHGGCYAVASTSAGDRLLTATLDQRLVLWDARSRWCDEWRFPGRVSAAFWADADSVWVRANAGLQRWRRGERPTPVVPAVDESVERRTAPGYSLVVPFGTSFVEVPARGGGAAVLRGPDGVFELVPRQDTLTDPRWRIALASVAADARADRIALGGSNGDVLVTSSRGEILARHDLELPRVAVMGLGWLRDGSLLAACRDGQLRRIDADGRIVGLGDRSSYFFRLAVSPDGGTAAIANGERRVLILDAWTGAPLLTLPPMGGAIRTLEFAPDGRHLLVATDNGDVRIWPLLLTTTATELVASSPYQQAIEIAAARRGESR